MGRNEPFARNQEYKAVPRHIKFLKEWRGTHLYALVHREKLTWHNWFPPTHTRTICPSPAVFEEHCKRRGWLPEMLILMFLDIE